jgi:CHASE2 domain-containing sensor protein
VNSLETQKNGEPVDPNAPQRNRQEPPVQSGQTLRHRELRSSPYREFLRGAVLAVLLIGLKVVVEHGEFGKQLEQMTYNLLQLRLLSHADRADSPIAIVDISGMTPIPIQYEGKAELVTPRGSLLGIVAAIARQKPRAIGIDLNFSPGNSGYLTPDDPVLLQSLLDIRRQGLPVYVGIYDSVVLAPAKWLGQPQFQPLAAYITIPNPEHTEPSTRMVEWVRPAGVSAPCFSLPYALAHTEQASVPRTLRWAARRAAVTTEAEFAAAEFLIDYGPIEKLIAGRIIADNEQEIARQGQRLAGKIVLVGRASPGQSADQFNVPGRGMPVPGIYVHGAAVHTLLRAPLYRLTAAGRIVADALAALLVFGPILLARLYSHRRALDQASAHRLHVILTSAVILAVLILGYSLVDKTRLIWTDHLMVIGALLLHSPMEHFLEWLSGWLRGIPQWLGARGTRAEEHSKEQRGKHEDAN